MFVNSRIRGISPLNTPISWSSSYSLFSRSFHSSRFLISSKPSLSLSSLRPISTCSSYHSLSSSFSHQFLSSNNNNNTNTPFFLKGFHREFAVISNPISNIKQNQEARESKIYKKPRSSNLLSLSVLSESDKNLNSEFQSFLSQNLSVANLILKDDPAARFRFKDDFFELPKLNMDAFHFLFFETSVSELSSFYAYLLTGDLGLLSSICAAHPSVSLDSLISLGFNMEYCFLSSGLLFSDCNPYLIRHLATEYVQKTSNIDLRNIQSDTPLDIAQLLGAKNISDLRFELYDNSIYPILKNRSRPDFAREETLREVVVEKTSIIESFSQLFTEDNPEAASHIWVSWARDIEPDVMRIMNSSNGLIPNNIPPFQIAAVACRKAFEACISSATGRNVEHGTFLTSANGNPYLANRKSLHATPFSAFYSKLCFEIGEQIAKLTAVDSVKRQMELEKEEWLLNRKLWRDAKRSTENELNNANNDSNNLTTTDSGANNNHLESNNTSSSSPSSSSTTTNFYNKNNNNDFSDRRKKMKGNKSAAQKYYEFVSNSVNERIKYNLTRTSRNQIITNTDDISEISQKYKLEYSIFPTAVKNATLTKDIWDDERCMIVGSYMLSIIVNSVYVSCTFQQAKSYLESYFDRASLSSLETLNFKELARSYILPPFKSLSPSQFSDYETRRLITRRHGSKLYLRGKRSQQASGAQLADFEKILPSLDQTNDDELEDIAVEEEEEEEKSSLSVKTSKIMGDVSDDEDHFFMKEESHGDASEEDEANDKNVLRNNYRARLETLKESSIDELDETWKLITMPFTMLDNTKQIEQYRRLIIQAARLKGDLPKWDPLKTVADEFDVDEKLLPIRIPSTLSASHPGFPIYRDKNQNGKVKIPAFYHTLVRSDKKVYGMLFLVPFIDQQLFPAWIAPPMIAEPRAWSSFSDPYYIKHTRFIRTSSPSKINIHTIPSTSRVEECMTRVSRQGWKINNEVLDVVRDVWLSGGEKLGLPRKKLNDVYGENNIEYTQLLSKARKGNMTAEEFEKYTEQSMSFTKSASEIPTVQLRLKVAEYFRNAPVIYFPHSVDFRGRAYPVPPHFNHQAGDLPRGVLLFKESEQLGERGLHWLKVHTSNLFGVDKVSHENRVKWTESHINDFMSVAQNPTSSSSIEFLETSDDPIQALAASFELANAYKLEDPEKYVSSYPVHQDGSCNGLQHYAALGKDELGARAVNVLPSDQVQDVYTYVLNVVKDRVAVEAGRTGVSSATGSTGNSGHKDVSYQETILGQSASKLLSKGAIKMKSLDNFVSDNQATAGAPRTRKPSATKKSTTTTTDNTTSDNTTDNTTDTTTDSVANNTNTSFDNNNSSTTVTTSSDDQGNFYTSTSSSEATNANTTTNTNTTNTTTTAPSPSSPSPSSPSPSTANRGMVSQKSRNSFGKSDRELAERCFELNLFQRKVVKQTVMTICYGVTFIGARDQILGQINSLVGTSVPSDEKYQLATYLARHTLNAVDVVFSQASLIQDWLVQLVSISTNMGIPVQWVSPIGLPCNQPYFIEESQVITTPMQSITKKHVTSTPNAIRQRLGIPPNFIHSLDASHMLMTADACFERNIPFAAVHDSFWTLPKHVDELNVQIREQFVNLYKRPILQDLYQNFVLRLRANAACAGDTEVRILIPPPPEKDLDIELVKQSKYFFH